MTIYCLWHCLSIISTSFCRTCVPCQKTFQSEKGLKQHVESSGTASQCRRHQNIVAKASVIRENRQRRARSKKENCYIAHTKQPQPSKISGTHPKVWKIKNFSATQILRETEFIPSSVKILRETNFSVTYSTVWKITIFFCHTYFTWNQLQCYQLHSVENYEFKNWPFARNDSLFPIKYVWKTNCWISKLYLFDKQCPKSK